MAAVLSLRVYTGASAATQSAAVTGIDMISADNATNTLGNRQANPVTVATNSFEKWLRLYIDTAPANSVSNFLVWGDGALQADVALEWGVTDTGATPTAATSTVATGDFTACVAGAKCVWDAGPYDTIGQVTDYLVLQLQVGADCLPGNLTQETINYSYDET